MKPMIRQEFALLHEDIKNMTEQDYAAVVMHQVWELENSLRKYGFARLAAIMGLCRMELMHFMPDFRATQPAPEQASSAPVFYQQQFTFVAYDREHNRLNFTLPVEHEKKS